MQFPRSWRRLASTAWYICATIAIGIFILSLSAHMVATAGDLQAGLIASVPSGLLFALNIASFLTFAVGALISFILSGVLFSKRTNERMALFLSFFLLVIGVIVAGPSALELIWSDVSDFVRNVIQPLLFAPLLIAFFTIFPNGRFVPEQARWLVIVSLLYAPVSVLALNADALLGSAGFYLLGVMPWFGLIFAGIYAQIYRYRHVSNPTERQQTKWVVFGFSLAMLFALLATIWTLWFDRLPARTPIPWWAPVIRLGWSVTVIALPVSLTLAVMRYRLYDIDILINRTLVYGALTGTVIAIYALIVGAFGMLFQSSGNLVVALIATGMVAVLFQPLRARLQVLVNRIMYGERDEPLTVLRRLGERLEVSTAPEDLLPAIVETVAQALKLPYAEITLRRETEFERAARYGKVANGVVQFPIPYQSQTIGYLNVSPRGPGESLAESDKRLLRQIAQQAGPVTQAVQLTRDLRRSRARLVTAREEERSRLRRDLHDGLGPVLASQGLKIAAVNHLLDSDNQTARQLLKELASQNEATVSEIRRLVYALRPPELDELGLVGAVRDYASGLDIQKANGRGLQINIRPPDGELHGLPAAVEIAAYRIATEALTNVVRHAQAHNCTVKFDIRANGHEKVLWMEIKDDGIGFSKDRKSGVGMNSMRERAEEMWGELRVESIPHQGTRVFASFPLVE